MRIVLIATFWFCSFFGGEFLYPVGVSSDEEVVYVIYQKTNTHLELWEWDYKTRYANQMLLSRYSPAGFVLLPDKSGFSFIDDGVLKVKQFIKRSPRIIEYDAPLYNVELVNWIDSYHCYASGKYNDYFGIFQIDWDGVVAPIVYQHKKDALYPQKIGDSLFYIERTEESQYQIKQVPYHLKSIDTLNEKFSSCSNGKSECTIIDFKEKPIAFLRMISENEGFVVEYPQSVSKNEDSILFNYHHFKYNNGWTVSLLFTFNIPTEFLIKNEMRLYESILPLLPCVSKQAVYYVDSSESGFLSLYWYDLINGKNNSLGCTNQHVFGIKESEKGVFYGGVLKGEIYMREGVEMGLGFKGEFLHNNHYRTNFPTRLSL